MGELTPDQKLKLAKAKTLTRQRMQQAQPAPQPQQDFRGDSKGSALGAAGRMAIQGLTFGFGDELGAGASAVGDVLLRGAPSFGDAYAHRLADERGQIAQMREENPVASAVGEIAGAAVLPGGAIKGATMGQRMASAGRVGGAMGAAYGFGEGEGGFASRARSAGVGGAAGTAGGMAAPFVLGGITGALNKRATNKAVRAAAEAAPEPSALRQESRAIFKGLEQRGVGFNDDASVRLLGGLVEDLQGFDGDVAPVTMKKIGRLADKAEHGLTLSGLMNTREVLNKVAMNRTSDGAAASTALKRIDDFVGSLLDSDAAGDVAGLGEDWKQARSLWKRFKNSERLQKAIVDAGDAASGEENGLRIEFRKILKDKKMRATLSPEEMQVVREVVRGSTMGNLLRRFAGWGGGEGQQRNLLNMSAGMALGYGAGRTIGGEIGGLAGAGAVMGAGKLAARGAEASTDEAAQRALNFVANGGQFVRPEPLMLPGWENALSTFGRAAAPVGVNRLTNQ